MKLRLVTIAALVPLAAFLADGRTPARAGSVARPAFERFAADATDEVPDFQRHILPLMGRLGCNTRSCHGSFQGRGGFRLSLFGYDFKADHDALLLKNSGRVDTEAPELSKILQKPTLAIPHKGGKRMEPESWQYRMFTRWIEAGAKGAENATRFDRLEVTPAEIVFDGNGKTVPLKVIAHWLDGSSEDVTCISRFRTNDESVAEVNEDGVVTCKGEGDTHVVAFYDNGVAVTQVIRPVSDRVGPTYPDVPAPTKIDALIVEKLKKLGVVPSEVCNDAEFLRRVSLDLTGTLPTPAEIEAFLNDPSPSKRDVKIDELLARPTYSAWWATKLCDITGDNPRAFNNLPGNTLIPRHWYEWIERRLRENQSYDQIVAGIVLATSRKPGQSFDDYNKEQSTYYRDKDPADFSAHETMPYYWARRTINTPEDKALNFSHTFLGVRLECAQCHKHPFDQWTQDDFKQFTAFFTPIRNGFAPDARVQAVAMQKELGVDQKKGNIQKQLGDLAKEGKIIPWQEVFIARGAQALRPQGKAAKQAGAGSRVATPKLLGGDTVDIAAGNDPRKPLMDWMRSKENPYFARAFINRVWAVYFGRGIVNPPDDMNQANPPVNAPLIEYLADGFIAHDFDMKWLHREITLSQTYQRSWKSNETNRLDEKNFSHSVIRRLPAEVLVDAVRLATASTQGLALASTREGLEERAIGPKGGAGLARRGQGGDFASRVFGRSTRDTNCDCAASNEPNLLQSIYLQNDQDIFTAIDRRDGWLVESTGSSTSAGAAPNKRNRDELEATVIRISARIVELERQLGKFREEDKEKAVKDIEGQLASRRDDLARARRKLEALAPAEGPKSKSTTFDPDQVVREAFLRTLGRRPTEAESTRARDHLQAAGDHAKGLRDLLWALLNTKEFVTNH